MSIGRSFGGGFSGFRRSGSGGIAKPSLRFSGSLSISESAIIGTAVGVVTVKNGSGSYTYSISSDADNKFAINPSTGEITTSDSFDYETKTSHQVTIQADNGVDDPISRTFTIAVANVLEVTLNALTGTFSLPEDAAAGAVAGAISGKTSGSTLTLIDDAGGRVALSGVNILRGLVGLDYETAASHNFTLRETHPDAATRETTLTLTVTDVDEIAPTLSNAAADASGDLSVDTDEAGGTLYWYVSTSATPPSAADLKAGTGADDYGSQAVIATGEQTASASGLVTEVTYYAHFLHRDGAGNESAIATSAGFVVESGPAQRVIIAVMAGQSNMNGRNANDGLSVNRANKFALDSDSQSGTYLTLLSDTTALNHPEHLDRTGPDDQILDDLAVANPSAIVIGVPCCSGGTSFAVEGSGFWPGPDAGSSGPNYNDIITLTTTAVTLAQAAYPGCTIEPIMFLQIGENESSGTPRATVAAKAADYVTFARSRLAAATGVAAFSTMKTVLGMTMVSWWHPSSSNPGANARAVIAGFVDASLAVDDLYLVAVNVDTSASDNLHYQPAAKAREQGAAHLPALTRTDFPVITNAGTLGSVLGDALEVPITHDQQLDADFLCTAHIVGGADAALFEIDDAYGSSNFYAPKLRWIGNGTGPASEGDYVVQVALRNSAGAMGSAKAITVTVAEPAIEPVSAELTYANASVASPGYNNPVDMTVQVKAGLNLFRAAAGSGTNRDGAFVFQVNGVPCTKLYGSATGNNYQLWGYVSAIDTEVTLSLVMNYAAITWSVATVSVKGVDPTPTDFDLLTWANTPTGTSFAGGSVTCPEGGILIGFGQWQGEHLPTATSPTEMVGTASTTNNLFVLSRDSTGAIAWTGGVNGIWRSLLTVAFAPA